VKKYLALFLVALMAVSTLSAAGVVTTQKAEAVTQPTNRPVTVLYKPGTTYVYGPSRFNLHIANSPNSAGIWGTATSTGGLVYASITTTTQDGGSLADTGILWKLNLAGADWSSVKDKSCTVTATLGYLLQAKGDHDSVAVVFLSVGGAVQHQDVVFGTHSKLVTTTWAQTVKVSDLFVSGYGGSTVYVQAFRTPPGGPGQALSSAYVSSMTLRFNNN
jgi:hypothetical protein